MGIYHAAMNEALPQSAHALLRAGFDAGRVAFGPLDLTFDSYASDVVQLVRRAREALGLETTPDDLIVALKYRALKDLTLARACEAGCERAWGVLVSVYQPRLVSHVQRRGGRGATPLHTVSALLSDLALRPPSGKGRTQMGTYAGMGALGAWLATQVARRLWKDRRRRDRDGSTSFVDRERDARASPVWAGSVSAETAAALELALDGAWKALTAEERTCTLLKHRHGCAQRRIATLLGMKEYQVSRIVKRASEKLKAAIVHGVRRPSSDESSTWDHLKARLENKLATFEALEPLPGGAPSTETLPSETDPYDR